MAINFEELTSLQKQSLERIINLLFGKNYISANFGAITDSFYTIEYKDEYGNPPPPFIDKPTYGFTEVRTTDFPMPLLSRTLKQLVELGYLQKIYRNDDDAFQISDEFVEEAHRIFLKGSATSIDHIPAADRFVPINHNNPDVADAIEALERLDERIRASNELAVSPEERIALSREVKIFREALQQPVVRAAKVWNAIRGNGILVALMTHTSDAMLVAIAEQIIGHLTKAFGWS